MRWILLGLWLLGAARADSLSTEDGLAFKLAERLMMQATATSHQGRGAESDALHLQAAEEFLAFLARYPDSPRRSDALYNAGYSYRMAGRIPESDAIFKQFVDRWPDDRRSWPLLYDIATSYASTLDLPEAIRRYDALYQGTLGRDYENTATALYNSAYLSASLGNYREAAERFERYGRDQPYLLDAEEVVFEAGAQWERHDPEAAIAFYRRYLQRYGDASPPRALQARYRIAALTAASGRDAGREWEALLSAYAALSSPADPASRHLAAMAAIRLLEPQVRAFPSPSLPDPTPASIRQLLRARPAELRALEDQLRRVATLYDDLEATTAALYLAGKLHLAYAEMLEKAPIPAAIPRSARPLYRAALDREHVKPARETGIKRLLAALDAAAAAGAWTPWARAAQVRLARVLPDQYAPPREEIRGPIAFPPITAGPVPVRR